MEKQELGNSGQGALRMPSSFCFPLNSAIPSFCIADFLKLPIYYISKVTYNTCTHLLHKGAFYSNKNNDFCEQNRLSTVVIKTKIFLSFWPWRLPLTYSPPVPRVCSEMSRKLVFIDSISYWQSMGKLPCSQKEYMRWPWQTGFWVQDQQRAHRMM